MQKETFEKLYTFRKIIKEVGDAALSFDASGEIDGAIYNNEDLINATLIFNHVMGNIVIATGIKNGLNMEQLQAQAHTAGMALRNMIMTYTGLDMHKLVADSVAKK